VLVLLVATLTLAGRVARFGFATERLSMPVRVGYRSPAPILGLRRLASRVPGVFLAVGAHLGKTGVARLELDERQSGRPRRGGAE
jgi:hypothetical protein